MTDQNIENWLNRIDAKPKTCKNFTYCIEAYCEFLGKTTDQILKEYIQDIKDGKLMPERRIFNDIPNFLAHIKSKGLAPKTIYTYRTALKSFFVNNYIEFPITVKGNKAQPLPENANNFLKKDQIKQMMENVNNLRDRAIIITMATSGMAANEVRHLRMSNITIDENNIATVKLRRQKAQHDYVTFISPEAVEILKEYWQMRERIIRQPLSKFDYVFVGYPESHIRGNKPMTEKPFMDIFDRLGEKLGYKRETKGMLIPTRSHALRKWFSSTLRREGLAKDYVDALLGHVPDAVDSAYFQTLEETLKAEYLKYLPHLSFKNEIVVRSLDGEDAKKLHEENEKLKRQFKIMSEGFNEKLKSVEKRVLDNLVERYYGTATLPPDPYPWEEDPEKWLEEHKDEITFRLSDYQ